jgi:hypothetical protein
MAGQWFYCDECGDVRQVPKGEPALCPWNGADAEMIPVDKAVAEALLRAYDAAIQDDGTLVRIGRRALGRELDHAERKRWFWKTYANGRWSSTMYGASLRELARRARRRACT